MAFLTPYTRDELREIAVEEYEANAAIPVATDAGSGLGSFFDGDSLLAMVEQRQIMYLAAIARLGTIPTNADGSPNPDVDSFCSPFIGARGGQQPATGIVTFATPSNVATQIVVLVGTVVQAGTLLFTVIADSTNTAYSALLNGYPINAGHSSVNATVKCQTAGTIGNVQIGQINSLYSGPGAVTVPAAISSASNAAAFITGAAYESDAQYKARFTLRMSTGQGGTLQAMAAALLGIAPGVTWAIADRLDANGNTVPSYFTAVIAMLGQTGATPTTLISQAETALEGSPPAVLPTRPAGITYQVVGPSILTVSVGATIKVAPGAVAATVVANCTTAVSEYINAIGLPGLAASSTLAYLKIASILYGVAGVAQVDALVLTENSTNYTADLVATYAQLFAAGSMNFTTTS